MEGNTEPITDPAAQTDVAATVAIDLLRRIADTLGGITAIERAKPDAEQAGEAPALELLDRLQRHERDDVQHLLAVRLRDDAAQAVRQWLADAWRHGEVVADDDGAGAAAAVRPVDRFAVGAHGRR